MAPPAQPKVLWAQRKEELFVTVDVPNADEKTLSVSFADGKFTFSVVGGTERHPYATEIALYKEVDNASVKVGSVGRQIAFVVKKKEAEWWPRLTKDKIRSPNIQVDWSRWKEEDDDAEEFDASGFQGMNMGGMGGMGGFDFSQLASQLGGAAGGGAGEGEGEGEGEGAGDDSDDDLPDLEPDSTTASK